jgi:hephaestin
MYPFAHRPSTALNSGLRYAAAAAAIVAAAAHVPVTEDHLEQATYIGVLFIALGIACVLEAAMLVRRDTRFVWTAVTVTGAAAIAAFVWSRAVGLPLITDDVGNWNEPLAIVAVAAEALMTLLGLAALGVLRVSTTSQARRRPLAAGLVVLVVGLGSTGIAAAKESSGSGETMNMSGSNYWNAVGGGFRSSGVVRTYYVGADVVQWNYAPTGSNQITGKPFDDVADTYVKSGPGRIGSTYTKCLYRGYTDASFKNVQPRTDDAYLGILGPVIRAEVGDTIKVVFRNACPFPTSMHPHGVFYTKSSEGAPYNDGTSGNDKGDDDVATGHTWTYTWQVPDRAGPGPHDGSSVMWMYHSHSEEVSDTYAGLMGPIEITARGMARADGSPKDVDREFFVMYSVMNENKSPFLEQNEHTYEKPYENTDSDDDFEESNLMHSINGYVFGNQPMMTMRKGERVRWYVMSMGTEVDLHTPHWHGNDVTVGGMRMDVVSLLPASMVVADMVPDNPGVWLFHCHVNDHITAGMLTRYEVDLT